jgi:hypothetical protein
VYPFDGGVDVHAEQVGEDSGGQVGGKVDQCRVAGCAGLDAVIVELADEAVDGQMPAGHLPGEQPAGRASPAAEHGGGRGGCVRFLDEAG